jgi:hypothetical protein
VREEYRLSIATRHGELFLLRQCFGDVDSGDTVSAELVYLWNGRVPSVEPQRMQQDLTCVTIVKGGKATGFCFMVNEYRHDGCSELACELLADVYRGKVGETDAWRSLFGADKDSRGKTKL